MTETRTSPMPGQVLQTVDDWDDYDAAASLRETAEVEQAHIITSLAKSGKHKPILDIDFPAQIIPSSTEGHFHLYIDHEIEWDKYLDLITLMADVGILQPGYVRASEQRGFTAVRLPWVRKDDMEPTPRCVGCGKSPSRLEEYWEPAADESMSPAQYVRRSEGTFNRENGHFWCTRCYIAAGQPLGVAP